MISGRKEAAIMNDSSATICAIATPPGEGGIAVVRLSGPDAYKITEKVFIPIHLNKRVKDAKGYSALFGHFIAEGQQMDETVALFYRKPHSYTGEDVVELSVHGGSAMAQCLIEALISAGAKPAGAGEFTRRAFENGRIGLTQAEAVMDIISAGGRQGAALGLAALEGALAKKIGSVQQKLTNLAAHISAWVDYPEEDVPALENGQLTKTLAECRETLDQLIRNYNTGAVIRRGVDAVLLGKPNVGKSTLLNLMAGFDRAIVTPVAGTTRDIVEQSVMLGGIRINLFDTAGIRQTCDIVEAEGIRRSYKKLEEAAIILAVFDGSEIISDNDIELAERCRGKTALAIVNKNDLEQKLEIHKLEPCFKKVLCLSANDPGSLSQLEKAVQQLLGITEFDSGAACLAGERQLSAAVQASGALQEASNALKNGFGLDAIGVCVDDALNALYELTGEKADEAVIHSVFEKFCVGK